MEEAWRLAIETSPLEGQVTLVITEGQLTAFLADRLRTPESPLLHDPQVRLRAGEIQVTGVTTAGPLAANAELVVQPLIDDQGALSFAITSAQVGPLPVPESLKGGLAELLTEAFTGRFGSLATGIRITSLAIGDGEAAIVGELR